jgi:hypothetical protein
LEHVTPTGGLKLALEPAAREDRRTRFAHLEVSSVDDESALSLVTDARGRMRYRLPDGEYQLSVSGGPQLRFIVRDRRWTLVRLQLT